MLRITTAILLTAALFGCDGKNTENQTATSPSPAGIPAETYMGDRPADVQDLLEIKKTAVVVTPSSFSPGWVAGPSPSPRIRRSSSPPTHRCCHAS